ncbi:hypothetical protein [Streptomyces sp. NPDC005244]|uniref:hypothetical protein n=1 Tax=Streptomyces sp. NPDC005244 TaxID=3364708 RepID=UPI0036943E5C
MSRASTPARLVRRHPFGVVVARLQAGAASPSVARPGTECASTVCTAFSLPREGMARLGIRREYPGGGR